MSPDVTNKTGMNIRLTGKFPVNNDLVVNFNQKFEVQNKVGDKLKIVYNGLEYEVFDIEGHLMMNRVHS